MAVEMRTIGDMTLPVVGVGCWSFGSAEGEYWGNRDQETTNEIVAAALELNPSTFFDTAEVKIKHHCAPSPLSLSSSSRLSTRIYTRTHAHTYMRTYYTHLRLSTYVVAATARTVRPGSCMHMHSCT